MNQKLRKKIENKIFHKMAKKVKKFEKKGKFKEAGILECMLEENNRCLCCGREQFFDEEYYKRTGMWKCPECDGE